ncbi:PHO85 cyclin-1 [Coemansia sp. RSA 485]|nr:PHO85 cyclin-1 [Coemansia sp. RSA 485]
MCAQTDYSHGSHGLQQASSHRPLHLNMSTPLTTQTLDTIQSEITKDMIAVIAAQAKNVIPCTPAPLLTSGDRTNGAGVDQIQGRSGSSEKLPSPPSTPGGGSLTSVPPLDAFITNLVLRSRVQAGTLICTLVYLQRLRRRLPKEARGMECTCHRIFLATLIVAGKYLNDASPKNRYWARYSTVFTVAEVNLMEKQLLFLLDFDLRIDNQDLNEAASVFIAETQNSDIPLTPTTPPFGSVHPHTGGLKPPAGAHMGQSDYRQPHVRSDATSKIYPPTLGLGAPQGVGAMASSASSSATHTIDNHRDIKPTLPTTAPSSGTHSLPRRQHFAERSRRHSQTYQQRFLSADQRDPVAKSAAGPLQQISEHEMSSQPSPKKRAVSRGYHENIPHPSPVYYCNTGGGTSGSSATVISASTACFLQPLEQASLNYASSRYQQQRYDPEAPRSGNIAVGRVLPRTSSSIPSLRAMPSGNTTSASSPVANSGYTAKNCTGNKRALRPQSTLPELCSRDLVGSGYYQPHNGPSSTNRMPSRCDSTLPTLPPPARLASESYTSETSPVNTLVYDYSPATAAATISASYSRRPTSRVPSTQLQPVTALRDAHSTLPVSALSALSVAPELAAAAAAAESADDSTLTNNRKQHSQYSYEHSASHRACDLDSSSMAANADHPGNSSGWHLKSKILHPLSTWFRSSRQQSQQQQSGSHGQSQCEVAQCTHKSVSSYAFDPKASRSKGGRARDSRPALEHMSPLHLEPPMNTSAMPAKFISN